MVGMALHPMSLLPYTRSHVSRGDRMRFQVSLPATGTHLDNFPGMQLVLCKSVGTRKGWSVDKLILGPDRAESGEEDLIFFFALKHVVLLFYPC